MLRHLVHQNVYVLCFWQEFVSKMERNTLFKIEPRLSYTGWLETAVRFSGSISNPNYTCQVVKHSLLILLVLMRKCKQSLIDSKWKMHRFWILCAWIFLLVPVNLFSWAPLYIGSPSSSQFIYYIQLTELLNAHMNQWVKCKSWQSSGDFRHWCLKSVD